ncbi:MAG: phosphohistidine phosphatase SixA [Candidatus Binatia bacterium]
MNLYLMRHGIAVAADDLGSIQDKERPLTGKGIKRMRRAARGLRRLEIEFDGILTSPLLRARQTADIVAAALGMESRLEEITELAPESSVHHLILSLTRYRDRDHLLLVGHQPLLGQTLSSLIDPSPGAKHQFDLSKGSLCRVEIDGLPANSPGVLRWLMTAKQLRLLADRSAKN